MVDFSAKNSQFIPGTIIDVEASKPKGARFKSRLIGVDPGNFLILKMPDLTRAPFLKEALVETNPLVVRFMAEDNSGECLAFRSAVKWLVGYPVKMLFIAFPENIETRQLRTQSRAQTRVPAKILSEIESVNVAGEMVEVSVPGVIVDISKNGCRFTFKAPKNTKGLKSKDVQVQLSLGEQDSLTIPGEVCNQKAENDNFSVGIKFTQLPDEFDSQIKSLLLD